MRGEREGERGNEGGFINTHLSISTICIFTSSITKTHTHT